MTFTDNTGAVWEKLRDFQVTRSGDIYFYLDEIRDGYPIAPQDYLPEVALVAYRQVGCLAGDGRAMPPHLWSVWRKMPETITIEEQLRKITT